MRVKVLKSYLFVFLLVACVTTLQASDLKAPAKPEQSVTVLPDGRRLFLGGFDSTGRPSAEAKLADGSGDVQAISAVLQVPRAGHTATVLPDGTVFWIWALQYAVGRFVLGFFRVGDPTHVFGLRQDQVIALLVMAAALPMLARLTSRARPATRALAA